MADPDFWRDLAAKFRALASPYRDALSADWFHVAGSGTPIRYTLIGGLESTRLEFESLARRGSLAFGNSSVGLLTAWLDMLREEFPSDIKNSVGVREVGGVQMHDVGGSISNVCAKSADLCTMLEGQALEQQPIVTEPSALQPLPPTRKRGRPQVIPEERKLTALAIRDAGGTNRDAAVEIYGNKYPTAQQVKNASTILRYFRQGMKKSKSKSKKRSDPQ